MTLNAVLNFLLALLTIISENKTIKDINKSEKKARILVNKIRENNIAVKT